jgi:hypothetical protein
MRGLLCSWLLKIFSTKVFHERTPELYQGKCKALFEHVYENYVGSGISVYTVAA